MFLQSYSDKNENKIWNSSPHLSSVRWGHYVPGCVCFRFRNFPSFTTNFLLVFGSVRARRGKIEVLINCRF